MKTLLTLKIGTVCLLLAAVLNIWNVSAQGVGRSVLDKDAYGSTVGELKSPVRTSMVNSAFPVTIEVKGSRLCVISKYNQVLPIYLENGTFFGVFRLNKGTNWISGLPKGSYIINARKITIP